jgi:anti-anti-sigma regulatory factor
VRHGLQCKVIRAASGDRIEVHGKLTARSRKQVVDLLWRETGTSGHHVTVDLAGVTYFDGTSVLVLIGNKQIIEGQRGCHVDLTGLDTATRRILALPDLAPSAR